MGKRRREGQSEIGIYKERYEGGGVGEDAGNPTFLSI